MISNIAKMGLRAGGLRDSDFTNGTGIQRSLKDIDDKLKQPIRLKMRFTKEGRIKV